MNIFRKLMAGLKELMRKDRSESELDEELNAYVQNAAEAKVRAGVTGHLQTGFFSSSMRASSSPMSCSNFLRSRSFSMSLVSSVRQAYWLASNMFLLTLSFYGSSLFGQRIGFESFSYFPDLP